MTEPPTIVINRDAPAGRKTIQAYGNGGFTIDRVRFEGSVLVFPLRVVAWPVTRFDEVTVDSVADALSGVSGVELLLVGCGTRGEPAPAALRDGLREAGDRRRLHGYRRGLPHLQRVDVRGPPGRRRADRRRMTAGA